MNEQPPENGQQARSFGERWVYGLPGAVMGLAALDFITDWLPGDRIIDTFVFIGGAAGAAILRNHNQQD